MKPNNCIGLFTLSFLALWSLNPQATSAQSSQSFEIAQFSNPDSSGSVGDSFSSDLDSVRQQRLIKPVSVDKSFAPSQASPPSPGSTIGVPSAYGASQGDGFMGFSGAVTSDKEDAAATVGMGFGDPRKSVGFEVGLGLAGLFGDNAGAGLIGFKLHRAVSRDTRVALGWANAIRWDVASAGNTVYGSVTHRLKLQPTNNKNQLPLTMTMGLGTGAYRSIGALDAGNNSPNLFGSLGLRIIPQVSVISSWTGSQLNLGTSLALFNNPFVINLGITDVTGNRDFEEGRISRTGFLFSTGYAYKF